MVQSKNLDLKVAWISGDEVLPALQKAREEGKSKFENICTGEVLDDWKFEPIYAQAYLGGLGIAAAFEKGADIVVCGRVSDASPCIGAATWWHGWKRDQLHELANAFVTGHLIECSNYVCGGNFTGFKSLEWKGTFPKGESLLLVLSMDAATARTVFCLARLNVFETSRLSLGQLLTLVTFWMQAGTTSGIQLQRSRAMDRR